MSERPTETASRKAAETPGKTERLAEALRLNLLRRKARKRARDDQGSPGAAPEE